MNRCRLCGNFTQNEFYCQNCLNEIGEKTFKQFLRDENHLINLLYTVGCNGCPIHDNIKYCHILVDNHDCLDIQDEADFCKKYLRNWLNNKN